MIVVRPKLVSAIKLKQDQDWRAKGSSGLANEMFWTNVSTPPAAANSNMTWGLDAQSESK